MTKGQLVSDTLEKGNLARFPKSAENFRIRYTSSMEIGDPESYTWVKFTAPAEDIEAWILLSRGIRNAVPQIIVDG